ncbi:MAG: DUF4920 domain-containing protein [Acidobacteria bacterium]|nr:DUF4920 domain-containing protein [Acidobacteriota bacterium]
MRKQWMTWAMVLAGAGDATAAERYGKGLTLSQPTPVATILASPEQYVGKTVQVRGKVTEVCTMMGCWMQVVDQKNGMRIKVNDGEMVFPRTAVGKTATAEGVLKKLVLSKEQAVARARHEAEEQGRKFDPASVKSGLVIYQVQGTGALVGE